ncbi:hypothetical protein Syun_012045 [Stephania yunnanensis]|uniref:Uncharacterized protein n=1 Tax=Stephania yunnanensis TaxID=152371 RepID=A0AAP0PIN1_9MAGN
MLQTIFLHERSFFIIKFTSMEVANANDEKQENLKCGHFSIRTSRENIHVGANVDSHITVDLYDHEINPSLCTDKKEKKAPMVQPVGGDPCTSIGPNDGAEVTLKHAAAYRTLSSSVGNACLMYSPEMHLCNISTGQAVISCDPSIHQHNDECCRIVLGERKQKRASTKIYTKMCHKENPKPKVGEVASKNRVYVADVDKNEAPLNTAIGNISKIHPRDLDESDDELPKDDEENNIDEGGSFPKRRTKKLRLLDDIIKSEALGTSCNSHKSIRKENDDHINTDDVLSKSLIGAFTRIGRDTDSKWPMPFEAKDQGSNFGLKKKKKMPQNEDDVPFKMGCLTATEELETFKGDMSSSFLRRLDSLANSYLIKHGTNVRFNLVNKVGKVHDNEDRDYSLVPRREDEQSVFQNTGREIIKCTEAGSGCPKAAEDESTRRGSPSDIPKEAEVRRNDKRIIFSGNKHAKSRGNEGKALAESAEDIITGRNHNVISGIDPKSRKAAAISFRYSQDALAACKQYDPSHVSKFRNHDIGKKQNSIFPVGIGGKTPQFENGPFSALRHPEASSDGYNYEKSIAERHPLLWEKQFDQRTSKTHDQASCDDIPMEIVELMAKNQHERHRSNADHAVRNSYWSSWNNDKGKVSGPVDFTNVLGNEMLQLFDERKSLMPSAHFNNEESSVRKGGLTKRKMDDYISPGSGIRSALHPQINQQEQYHLTMRPHASCHVLPGANYFSTSAPSRNLSNQKFIWNDDVLRHKCSPPNLKSSEVSHLHPTFAQHSSGREDQCVWSSMGPNCAAFKASNCQKLNTESSNFGTVSQCLDLFPHAYVNENHGMKSPKTINLEKQVSEVESETSKRPYVDHPFACTDRGREYQKTMRPLDFCANETIPAMHLLRLMHAGVSSTAPLHVEKDRDFSKQSSFSCNHPCRDFIELEVGKRKHIHQPESDYFLKNCNLGKSCNHLTSEPKDIAVGTSVKMDDNMRSSFTSKCYVSNKWVPGSDLKFQAKEKTKSKKPPRDPRSKKSNRSIFENSTIDGMQKGFHSASNSGPSGIQSHGIEDSAVCFLEDISNKNGRAGPITRSCSTELCTVNRNPADFTIPEAGNAYMIGPGDLRRGKMSMPCGKSGLTHELEGHKKQKMMKLTSYKSKH